MSKDLKDFNFKDQRVDTYQEFVQSTCIHKDTIYPLLGLGGEVGEFIELAKKAYRKSGDGWWAAIDREQAVSELGDIVWYVTRIASILGIPMSEVLDYNTKKLLSRRANDKQETKDTFSPVS